VVAIPLAVLALTGSRDGATDVIIVDSSVPQTEPGTVPAESQASETEPVESISTQADECRSIDAATPYSQRARL
jgi:hypothetical protein